jgi:hypothetical protein
MPDLIASALFLHSFTCLLHKIDVLTYLHCLHSSSTGVTRLGRRFARALVTRTLEGKTVHQDAFRLLGLSKLATLRELG